MALAQALDQLATATTACDLEGLSTLIQDEAKKLTHAEVHIEGGIKVLVDGADVYDDIYQISKSMAIKDYESVGLGLAKLINDLALSTCSTKECVLVDGILRGLQILVHDGVACKKELASAFKGFHNFVKLVDAGDYKHALGTLGKMLGGLSVSLSDCGLQNVADLITSEAKKLGHATIVDLPGDVKIMVAGR